MDERTCVRTFVCASIGLTVSSLVRKFISHLYFVKFLYPHRSPPPNRRVMCWVSEWVCECVLYYLARNGDYTQCSDTFNICSHAIRHASYVTNDDSTLSFTLFFSHFIFAIFSFVFFFNKHLSFCLSFHLRHFSFIFAKKKQ